MHRFLRSRYGDYITYHNRRTYQNLNKSYLLNSKGLKLHYILVQYSYSTDFNSIILYTRSIVCFYLTVPCKLSRPRLNRAPFFMPAQKVRRNKLVPVKAQKRFSVTSWGGWECYLALPSTKVVLLVPYTGSCTFLFAVTRFLENVLDLHSSSHLIIRLFRVFKRVLQRIIYADCRYRKTSNTQNRSSGATCS